MSEEENQHLTSAIDNTADSANTPQTQSAVTPAHTGNLPHPKKKRKNKKKKTGNRPSQTLSEATGGAVSAPTDALAEPLAEGDSTPSETLPETLFTLPVRPDEWFIQPASYDDEGNLITEETFTFLRDGVPIITMPLNADNFGGLSELLNARFPVTSDDTEADYFHIRKPLSDSDDANPVMTLTQRNRILATTVLDQKSLKQLIRALQQHVIQHNPVTSWLNRWWRKHKIWRVILIIAASPIALLVLYSIFWGATH